MVVHEGINRSEFRRDPSKCSLDSVVVGNIDRNGKRSSALGFDQSNGFVDLRCCSRNYRNLGATTRLLKGDLSTDPSSSTRYDRYRSLSPSICSIQTLRAQRVRQTRTRDQKNGQTHDDYQFVTEPSRRCR
ncbi:hypothetical protein EV561_15910 [Rhizobium sp. BK376]|nr:hypothetical protein EV561_15910 [Rhizobium sp. BK376]